MLIFFYQDVAVFSETKSSSKFFSKAFYNQCNNMFLTKTKSKLSVRPSSIDGSHFETALSNVCGVIPDVY